MFSLKSHTRTNYVNSLDYLCTEHIRSVPHSKKYTYNIYIIYITRYKTSEAMNERNKTRSNLNHHNSCNAKWKGSRVIKREASVQFRKRVSCSKFITARSTLRNLMYTLNWKTFVSTFLWDAVHMKFHCTCNHSEYNEYNVIAISNYFNWWKMALISLFLR